MIAELLKVAAFPLALGSGVALAMPAAAQDRVMIGAGVALVPDFQGSEDYRVRPVLVVDIQAGKVFASMSNGLGVYLVDTPGIKVGTNLTYVAGYRRRDVPEGIDPVRNAAGARMFASTEFGGAKLTVGATRSLGGTNGIVVDGSLGYRLFASERVMIAPAVRTTWASGRHMNGYFGVDRIEALASGLSAYRTESGLKDVGAVVNANLRLSQRLNLTGSVGATRLFDRAADSPLVERQWQPVGFVGLSYGF